MRIRCSIATALFTLACLGAGAARAQAPVVSPPMIQGTVVQLLERHRDWSDAEWRRVFGYFRVLGLSQIVIQWSAYEEITFFARGEPAPARSPLETLLRLADENRMRVLVGLRADPVFWQRLEGHDEELQAYLAALLPRQCAVAEELAVRVRGHPSFQGWYIWEEINDASWSDDSRRAMLYAYLRNLSAYLQLLTPGARVALSGFSDARADPETVRLFWSGLLQEAWGIDLVLFQDGVGAGKLDPAQLPAYFAAIRDAARPHSREVKAVTEVFRQVGGPPLDGGPFRAVPATFERVRNQLEAVAPYTTGSIAFSVMDYMIPDAGPEQAQLFRAYLREMPAFDGNRGQP